MLQVTPRGPSMLFTISSKKTNEHISAHFTVQNEPCTSADFLIDCFPCKELAFKDEKFKNA